MADDFLLITTRPASEENLTIWS